MPRSRQQSTPSRTRMQTMGRQSSARSKAVTSSRSKAAWRRKQFITAILAEEKKFFRTNASITLAATTDSSGLEADPSTESCLFSPAQGDTANSRTGNKAVVESVSIRGQILLQASDDVSAATMKNRSEGMRYWLVLDKETNNAQLASENVLVNDSGNLAGCASALRNTTKGNRYKVLRSGYIEMPPLSIATGSTSGFFHAMRSAPFEIYWKGVLPVNFSANNGTVADIVDNSLHLLVAPQSETTVASSLTVLYNCTVAFKG